MKLNQELIKQLQEGKIGIYNIDGTLEQLREILKTVFPFDRYVTEGNYKYYSVCAIDSRFWNNGDLRRLSVDHLPISKFFENQTDMNELKITKEKVLEAASKCSTAKETLKTLFPEVFEDEKYFDLDKLITTSPGASPIIFTDRSAKEAGISSGNFFQIRKDKEFKNRGFLLSSEYNWEIVTDSTLTLVLVPTKRKS